MNALDLGRAIRGARIQAGLSQLELARRGGVSRKLVGELEAGKDTAELGPALRVAAVLGLTWQAPAPTPQSVLDEAAEAVRDELSNGDIDFTLRLALDAFKRLQAMEPTRLRKPRSTGDLRWDALLAAGARIALRGSKVKPRWGSRLVQPWFPAEGVRRISDAYRQLTVRRTPKEFADFNIFLNDKSFAA
ncbi:helix-turn-helix domain-containing protein [Arthrobacter sp. ISL-30]|uniref:helix-turn-helix domain-containing protein n=1 Tax=Arthrobacter sp. ISL-30 TaxID=2819109 RepID=UPI001BE4EC5B|nr:helix-turn-helix domain-containing protein [Arthrobacter sp. ISL-30]MBT2515460.1 helix-turn-helix transcriptional regulator [Arthrobacter sp. ISL-30]